MVNRSKQLVANILTAGAMASLLCVSVAHAQKLPRFTDYPVSESFSGKTAPLLLSGEARSFRTRLKEAAREKPNFAGHFIVTTWGCGTECIMGAIIDASTGRVFLLPTTLCCWGAGVGEKFNPVEFRPNSKLIILSGARNEKEGDSATRFYKFENNRLVLIRSIPR